MPVRPANARSIIAPEADALVSEVEAVYAADGPPARTVVTIRDADGAERIRLGRLFIECAICGTRQPQSQTRQSPPARRLWVAMHLRCPE